MLLGPHIRRACPFCGSRLQQITLASSNLFGAVMWSDGWIDAPMCWFLPPITRCVMCGGFVWVTDAREIERYDGLTLEACILDLGSPVQHVRKLTHMEYLEAVSLRCWRNCEQERQLRTLAWQASNNPCRVPHYRFRPRYICGDLANLDGLVRLLDLELAVDRMTAVEIARLRGDFTEAERLLRNDWEPRLAPLAERQARWVALHNRRLQVLVGRPMPVVRYTGPGWKAPESGTLVIENGRFTRSVGGTRPSE